MLSPLTRTTSTATRNTGTARDPVHALTSRQVAQAAAKARTGTTPT